MIYFLYAKLDYHCRINPLLIVKLPDEIVIAFRAVMSPLTSNLLDGAELPIPTFPEL